MNIDIILFVKMEIFNFMYSKQNDKLNISNMYNGIGELGKNGTWRTIN